MNHANEEGTILTTPSDAWEMDYTLAVLAGKTSP